VSIPPELRFFFIHVMKTGGATFRQYAYHNFPSGEVYPDGNLDPDLQVANWSIEYLNGLSAGRRRSTRVFTGHFPFIAVELLGIDVVTLTILRDPVERTISRLRQQQHHDASSRPLRLEEIYEDPFFFPMHIHNHQAKLFAMTPQDRLESFMDVIEVDEERLERAKQNIERVDVLGLQERFPEFLEEVERRYGWEFWPLRRGHGVPPAPSEVARSFRRRIAEDNAADVAFYEYAQELSQRRRRERVNA
jgi:hypothetical protein